MQFSSHNKDHTNQTWYKSVLESNAVQEIGTVIDAKQYRQLSKNMEDALKQIRPNSRTALDLVEELTEDEINDANEQGIFGSKLEVISTLIASSHRALSEGSVCTSSNARSMQLVNCNGRARAEHRHWLVRHRCALSTTSTS